MCVASLDHERIMHASRSRLIIGSWHHSLSSLCSLAAILLFVSSSRHPKAAQPERWPLHWFLRIRMWWLGGWECFGAWGDLGHWLFNHQRKELQCIEGSACQRREELFRCEEFLVICALWNFISMPCRGAFFLGKPHLAGAAPGIFSLLGHNWQMGICVILAR